ncbi:MAG: hypothetical protein PVF66_11375 [Candidatus Aminicenantes bacterium]
MSKTFGIEIGKFFYFYKKLGLSRVEVALDIAARRETAAAILSKQKVEIATLPSVARNDIAFLDANMYYRVACDENLQRYLFNMMFMGDVLNLV